MYQHKRVREGRACARAERGVLRDAAVEAVMRRVDRAHYADFNPYFDSPQDIGCNATISAPHMRRACVRVQHAIALQLLAPALRDGETRRALDVGAGSGYVTACMALLQDEAADAVADAGLVVGVEHIAQLAAFATANLRRDQPKLLRDGRVQVVGTRSHAHAHYTHLPRTHPLLYSRSEARRKSDLDRFIKVRFELMLGGKHDNN
ncbi:Protein-L-isoaspartate(D-aspartate) O-methyltransferase [Gryllus bimaculatus]|nr:Protein-L-isoaspartate(D-aspartate) O-methyltransferase [Gryllus bimaculatus]